MLVEFTFGNFRSVRDKQTLSLVATSAKSKDPALDQNNTFRIDDDLSLLRTIAIYGANASGKTNVARAMLTMRRFVTHSSRESLTDEKIPVEPFLLDPKCAPEPTFFEVVFILEGKQYRYGFEATKDEIVAEWLYFVPTIREARLFERSSKGITISDKFPEGRRLIDKTRKNALFLSVVAQFNGAIAQRVMGWFNQFNIVSGLNDQATASYTIGCLTKGTNVEEIRSFVRNLDLGIQDIHVEEGALTAEELPKNLPPKVREALLETITNKAAVTTVHKTEDGQIAFDMGSESEGTQKLFALAGPFVDTLKNGKVLVIDEMDARLHPLITREIISLFNSPSTNPKNAQLIFVTHDTNLLSNRVFRRDQIWFTEKDRTGATHLFSMVEYKPRNDAAFERDYVQGRFGAIPFLGNLSHFLADIN